MLGSLIWPAGNQIFATEAVPATWTTGFPFTSGGKTAHQRERIKALFYAFQSFAGHGQAMPKTGRGDTGLSHTGGSRENV